MEVSDNCRGAAAMNRLNNLPVPSRPGKRTIAVCPKAMNPAV